MRFTNKTRLTSASYTKGVAVAPPRLDGAVSEGEARCGFGWWPETTLTPVPTPNRRDREGAGDIKITLSVYAHTIPTQDEEVAEMVARMFA